MIAAEYAGITFTAREVKQEENFDPTDGCEGCTFRFEQYRTCVAIGREAVSVGLPDCEAKGLQGGIIVYVRTTKGDIRQLDLAGPVLGDKSCAS